MAAIGGAAGSETSLLKLTEAYGLFPNNGAFLPATFHQSFVQDDERRNLPLPQSKQLADAGASFIITQMLRSVVGPQGTAANFPAMAGLSPSAPLAGKSGTGMVADVWFVGFTPRLIVGVWIGLPKNEVHLKLAEGFSGGKIAAPIVAKFIRSVRQIHPNLLAGDFERPANVRVLRIDPNRGCLTNGPGMEDFFIQGREPVMCH
jgi:penicillin-binding protein 1A